MPGPESRTVTSTLVWLRSVLTDSSRSFLNRAHCLDRVQDQIQNDLLQLNTIALNGMQARPGGCGLKLYSCRCASHHHNYLADRLIEVEKDHVAEAPS